MSTKKIQIIGGFPQADWNQKDATKPDYIKNKPGVLSASIVDGVLTLQQTSLTYTASILNGVLTIS